LTLETYFKEFIDDIAINNNDCTFSSSLAMTDGSALDEIFIFTEHVSIPDASDSRVISIESGIKISWETDDSLKEGTYEM
jgi:hypothetical protein